MIFNLEDMKRLDPLGSGTLADRHQQLFTEPKGGSFFDRESAWLQSRGVGRNVGTLGDRWRKLLGLAAGVRIATGIRALSEFPSVDISRSGTATGAATVAGEYVKA